MTTAYEEEPKILLMKAVRRWCAGLKSQIRKTRLMINPAITPIDGEQWNRLGPLLICITADTVTNQRQIVRRKLTNPDSTSPKKRLLPEGLIHWWLWSARGDELDQKLDTGRMMCANQVMKTLESPERKNRTRSIWRDQLGFLKNDKKLKLQIFYHLRALIGKTDAGGRGAGTEGTTEDRCWMASTTHDELENSGVGDNRRTMPIRWG